MFIVCNDFGDFYKKMNYNDLKRFLIDEIVRDGINRLDENDDKQRIKECLGELKELAIKDFVSVNYLKEQLLTYGWCVKDLLDLHRDLWTFKEYINKEEKVTKIDEVLTLIESEMNK